MTELISVVVVNWNGKKWLKKCLDSLRAQTYREFEIILVDNASKDDSVIFVRHNYPEVVLVQNKKNMGFAQGNNIGFCHAKGEYIFLLNNDTWIESNFLEKLIRAFSEIPHLGSVQSKIVLMDTPDKLDVCGSFWTSSSFLYHFGYKKNSNSEQYNRAMPFFSNKGASMMIKREVIDKIGLFDDDFWCYYEDTDFCHRVWLAGYECWYYPRATVYHAVGGSSLRFNNDIIQFHNFKNKLLSFLKNFQIRSLITILPLYIFVNMILSFTWLAQRKYKHFFSIYKALWWNMVQIRRTVAKRKKIQALRVMSDKEVFGITKKNPGLSYYYHLFIDSDKYKDPQWQRAYSKM